MDEIWLIVKRNNLQNAFQLLKYKACVKSQNNVISIEICVDYCIRAPLSVKDYVNKYIDTIFSIVLNSL